MTVATVLDVDNKDRGRPSGFVDTDGIRRQAIRGDKFTGMEECCSGGDKRCKLHWWASTRSEHRAN